MPQQDFECERCKGQEFQLLAGRRRVHCMSSEGSGSVCSETGVIRRFVRPGEEINES